MSKSEFNRSEDADFIIRSEELCRTFMELITFKKNVEDIVSAIGNFLGNVAYWDKTTGNIHISSRSDKFTGQIKGMPIHELISIYPHGTVEDRGDTYGYLFYYQDPKDQEDLLEKEALNFGITALRLATGNRKGWLDEEQKIREEVLQGLLVNNIKLVRKTLRKAASLGWHLKGPIVAMVIEISQSERTTDRDHFIAGWLKSRFPHGLQGWFSDDMVMLLPLKDTDKNWRNNLKNTMEGLIRTLKDKTPNSITIYTGVGSSVENIEECGRSHTEAREAITISRRYDKGSVAIWDNMGIYRLLSHIPEEESKKFVERYLSPLEKNDKNGELKRTIRALANCNWHMKEAAKKLDIHYNTMRYRFNQIEKRLSLSPIDSETKLNLSIAVILDEIEKDFS